MSGFIVLDLETVRNTIPFEPKAQAKLVDVDGVLQGETYAANPFPPSPCWDVVTVGYCMLNDRMIPTQLRVGSMVEGEEAMLRRFLSYCDENHPTFVGFNTSGFDIPVLRARAFHYGIASPFLHSKAVNHKYYSENHVDLKNALTNFGTAAHFSMEQAARLMGLPGKPEGVKGGSVEEAYRAGRQEEIDRYCLSDVVQTTLVFLRYEYVRGAMKRDLYIEAVQAMKKLVDEAPMPEGFCIDWPRVFR